MTRVLIVEDEPDLADPLAYLLQREGFEVEIAEDGPAALDAFARETEALSGGPQFISTLGWRWGRFSLLARHVSNASLHQPNDGETLLQGAWRF